MGMMTAAPMAQQGGLVGANGNDGLLGTIVGVKEAVAKARCSASARRERRNRTGPSDGAAEGIAEGTVRAPKAPLRGSTRAPSKGRKAPRASARDQGWEAPWVSQRALIEQEWHI